MTPPEGSGHFERVVLCLSLVLVLFLLLDVGVVQPVSASSPDRACYCFGCNCPPPPPPPPPPCGSSNTVYIYVSPNDGDVGVGSTSSTYGNGASLSESCGSSVSIFAEPNSGWAFASWSISGDGSLGATGAAATSLHVGQTSGGVIDLTLNLQESCNLPSGGTIQGNTPTGVRCYTPPISYYQNDQVTVGMTQYYFFGDQSGSYTLNQGVSYSGPVVWHFSF